MKQLSSTLFITLKSREHSENPTHDEEGCGYNEFVKI